MEIKLTKDDLVILREVEYNSRIFERELAAKCNLSKAGVKYRIKRLEELGIIQSVNAFVDYTKLGYHSYKLYLKLKATIDQKKKLKDFLTKRKEIFSIEESNDDWDLALLVFTKSREEYANFENNFLSKFGELVLSKDFCLMTNVLYLQNNVLHKNNKRKTFLVNQGEIKEIDEINKRLLKLLQENGKLTLLSLSEKLNLSMDSISKRIKKLTSSGIIPFFKTKIDYSKIGYEKYKLFIYVLNYSDEIEKNFLKFLESIDSVLYITKTLGSWRLEVDFLIKDYNSFDKVLSDLEEKFSENIQRLDFSRFRN